MISKYAEQTIFKCRQYLNGFLSMSSLSVVMSGEQSCPSLMLILASPSGRTIAAWGLPPIADRKDLWLLGFPSMRLCLLIWGSVRSRIVNGVRSLSMLVVAVCFFLRLLCINLDARLL